MPLIQFLVKHCYIPHVWSLMQMHIVDILLCKHFIPFEIYVYYTDALLLILYLLFNFYIVV